jgi:hypothetical protein
VLSREIAQRTWREMERWPDDERRDVKHAAMVDELKVLVANNTATVATCQVHINRNTEVLSRVENHFDTETHTRRAAVADSVVEALAAMVRSVAAPDS